MTNDSKTKEAEAVVELDALDPNDPEVSHADADAILLECVPFEVRAAYIRARERIGFWYA